jgi:outer membrane protein TolC
LLAFDRVVADTILTVRSRFYEVLFNDQLIKVREASVHLLEEQLENTKRRFEAGTVPKFDVLRAEVELANARPLLIQARNDLRIAKIRLANLLALNAVLSGDQSTESFPYVLVGELTYTPYTEDLTASLRTALEKRSEIKELEQQTAARKEGVHVAFSGYKPRLDIFGQFEARNPSLGDTKHLLIGTPPNTVTNLTRGSTVDIDPTIRGYSAGVEFTWDVFDGFSTHGRVVQARALYEAARLDLDEKKRDIALEVRTAHSTLQQAFETIESHKKGVEQGEESLRLAQARFNVGAGTQLDVLSAQTALTDARTTYARALYEYNVAVATLERVTGTSTQIANLEELRKKE